METLSEVEKKLKTSPSVWKSWRNDPVKFLSDVLSIKLAKTQSRILKSVRDNRRTLIVSGNGVGKSYSIASAIYWWITTRPDSVALLTSGSYSQMEDTTWRPLKTIVKDGREPLRGTPASEARVLDSKPPRIEMPEDEWYFKAVSPTNPDGLEGRHNQECLVVIEEADKPEIEEEHFESAGSSITDLDDRMVAVANPPKDESNVVYEKMKSDRWEVIQFSSFDSHNVLVDAGEIEDEHIPGLVTLDLIAEDWEEWNKRGWPSLCGETVESLISKVAENELSRNEMVERLRPGLEKVKKSHLEEDNLKTSWYRRRAGVIPPAGAEEHRPFYKRDVQGALEREKQNKKSECLGIGNDVARKGGDNNVSTALYEKVIEQKVWSGTDHNQNLQRSRDHINSVNGEPPVAVDAVGEGSGNADALKESHGAVRFKNGEKAVDEEEYYNKWTEALHWLGKELKRISLKKCSKELREELLVATRTIEYQEKHRRSGDVLKATPKDEIKETLGRSPDRLDSLAMACWVKNVDFKKKIRVSW